LRGDYILLFWKIDLKERNKSATLLKLKLKIKAYATIVENRKRKSEIKKFKKRLSNR
jgi:hypothetical protein